MPRHLSSAIVLAGLFAALAPHPVHAQSSATTPPILAPREVPALDQEMWAGVSYREALAGVAILGGSAVVVAWLSGSTIAGITAAASIAAAYIVYDPGVTGVLSPNDLPTLSDLSVNGSKQRD